MLFHAGMVGATLAMAVAISWVQELFPLEVACPCDVDVWSLLLNKAQEAPLKQELSQQYVLLQA